MDTDERHKGPYL